MDVYAALAQAKTGEKVTRVEFYDVEFSITKKRLFFDNGVPVTLSMKENDWVIVREPTHTTVTTESGRKVELTIEDAEKLNLL